MYVQRYRVSSETKPNSVLVVLLLYYKKKNYSQQKTSIFIIGEYVLLECDRSALGVTIHSYFFLVSFDPVGCTTGICFITKTFTFSVQSSSIILLLSLLLLFGIFTQKFYRLHFQLKSHKFKIHENLFARFSLIILLQLCVCVCYV